MRRSLFISAIICLYAAAPVLAQTYPAKAVILLKEVEVRSGPSKNFFPTSMLHQNDEVLVLRESKEAPGWLEIKPPKGSFSWINGKGVRQVDRHAVVDADPTRPVSVLPGSVLKNEAPNRESMKLTTGTIVVIVDRPLTVQGDTWLPIEPQPTEVRYIPVDSVKPAQVVATSNGPPNWTLGQNGFYGDPVLAEADKARQAGDTARARQLLEQVANSSPDPNRKQLAHQMLANLPTTPFQTTSMQPSRSALSPANPAPGGNLITTQGPAWSTYGWLRDTKLQSDLGQPIYKLEDPQGKATIYITTNPGKSLQSYLNRTIAVFGPTMYRSDVRMQYIVASHVAVP